MSNPLLSSVTTTSSGRFFSKFFANNGFLNVRPVLYVKSMQIDVNALLHSQKNNLPLGSVVDGNRILGYVQETTWDWQSLPDLSSKQLFGVFCVYLYAQNCGYNAGRKVRPAAFVGKRVTKWVHSSVLRNHFTTKVCDYEYEDGDVEAIQRAVDMICTIKCVDRISDVPAISATSYYRSLKNIPYWILSLAEHSAVISADVVACVDTWTELTVFLKHIENNAYLPSIERFDRCYDELLSKFFTKENVVDLVFSKLDKKSDWYLLLAHFMGFEYASDVASEHFQRWQNQFSADQRYFESSFEYETGYRFYQSVQLALLNKYQPNEYCTYLATYHALKRNFPNDPSRAERFRSEYNMKFDLNYA